MSARSILFLTPRYWPARDGTALHMQALAERFSQDGYQVEVLTADPFEIEGFLRTARKKIPAREETYNGVQILRVAARHWPAHVATMDWLARLPGEKNKIIFGPPHAYLPDLLKTAEKLNRKYSLIFAGVLPYRIFFYAAGRLREKMKIPLVGLPLIHLGEPARPELLRENYLNKINFSLLKKCNLLLLNTRAEAEPLLKAGFSPEQLLVAGAGIDPAALAGGSGQRFREKYGLTGPVVFMIGTQTHDKGSHHLVEALKFVWQKNPGVHLVLAGEVRPDFARYLERQAPVIVKKILILGSVSDEEKKDLLAAGDLLVMPSRADSFGMAYLEAWFYGQPVIGCYAGGVPEVIAEGQDGMLVPFGASRMLADCIEKILGDRNLAVSLGRRGQSKVLAGYTWEGVYQRVKKAAESLMDKNSA